MPSFFDHLLTINVPKIDKDSWPIRIIDLPEDRQNEYYISRNNAYLNLIDVEFQLAYHAHISIEDSDAMPSFERKMFFQALQRQKQEEADAIKKSTAKSSTKGR